MLSIGLISNLRRPKYMRRKISSGQEKIKSTAVDIFDRLPIHL